MIHGRAAATALLVLAAAAGGLPAAARTTPEDSIPLQQAILRAKEKVLPAVVNIQPVSEVYVAGSKRRVTAVGSGVIYSPRGYVLTNYHVAGKAKRLICTLFSKERVPAKLVGGDPYTDLAVIQLDLDRLKGHTLTWAALGDSDAVRTGEFVLALGSPLALSHSLSVGVVSATNRYFPDMRMPTGEVTGLYNTWIQTDAAINFGNSGGPLVNLRGEVIGINARKARAGENLGFAIPVNIARRVADELVAEGKVVRSWLGLRFQPLEDFEAYFSAGGAEVTRGVLVRSVEPGSPAEAAGVRAGDILVRFAGRPVDAPFYEDIPAIRRLIAETPVGKRVALEVIRGSRRATLYAVTAELGRPAGAEFECTKWGFTVKPLTAEAARRLGLAGRRGVVVTGVKPGSPAAEAALAAGDLVVEVGRKPVADLSSFRRLYERITGGKEKRVLLKVWRRGAVYYRLLKVKEPGAAAEARPAARAETRPAPRRRPRSRPRARSRPRRPRTRPVSRAGTSPGAPGREEDAGG